MKQDTKHTLIGALWVPTIFLVGVFVGVVIGLSL